MERHTSREGGNLLGSWGPFGLHSVPAHAIMRSQSVVAFKVVMLCFNRSRTSQAVSRTVRSELGVTGHPATGSH
jgi:hypothetical protein